MTENVTPYASDQPVDQPSVAQAPAVGAWPRYWATLLDLAILTELAVLIYVLVMPDAWVPEHDFAGKPSTVLLVWVASPITVLLEAAVYALLGTTPGKALAGIAVRRFDGARLSFGDYLLRTVYRFFAGLGTGFPLFTLIMSIRSYRRHGRGERQSWDQYARSEVVAIGGRAPRTLLVALAALLCQLVKTIYAFGA